ncbi:MAG TPA: MMPL family transporter [Methylococcaceae bacterium]|nr:MMPL family transporter [Methylococcaceae bacterium]
MSAPISRRLTRFISWWEAEILNHPWLVLLLAIVLSAYCTLYTMEHLTVDTDTADMISIELPFQQNRLKLERAFPQDANTVLLVVDGETPEQTRAAVRFLGERLSQDAQVASVYIPGEDAFFRKNGLLYSDLPDLEKLSSQLANAQPFIGRLGQNPSLDGFLGLLGDALKLSGDELPLDLNPLLGKVQTVFNRVRAGDAPQLSWQELMLDQKSGVGVTQRFIVFRPHFNYSAMLAAEQAIESAHRYAAEAGDGRFGKLGVRMTGEVVLEHEELDSISNGMQVASAVSMLLVCITLYIGYRSFRLMFATFLTLTMGLIFSLYFATISIGHLNLISIAFAVLFIGMGDAYSSHFCLRYRELILRGFGQREALLETLLSTGSALILCTLTAAIGLFAFIPTNYVGVSELGVIAGVSMFIALLTTFTVLPAIIKVLPLRPKPGRPKRESRWLHALLGNWPLRQARKIRVVTVIASLGAAGLLLKVEVDFNPINLRDPDSESVKTFKDLLKSRDTSPMTLAALADSEAAALEKKRRFEQLPTVDKVTTVLDYVPAQQEEKLALIEEMGLVLGVQLGDFPTELQGQPEQATLERLRQAATEGLGKPRAESDLAALTVFRDSLDTFLAHLDTLDEATRQTRLATLQTALLASLPDAIGQLRDSLEAEKITLAGLPDDLKLRWLSGSGVYRLQIFPKKDLNDQDALKEFIAQAQQVDPNVTDLPVTYLESMNEVVRAFQQAFGIALVAIAVLLLVILRNLRDTLLVLLPLLLAGMFTAAATVLFKIPFNFANIIALPLLFGLGVDSGIHMAHRLHYLHTSGGEENLLTTSEAQGVFYSALTTVFSFSSLAFTPHAGTASMGQLLAVGLMLTLLCALVVLPAFSELGRNGPRPAPVEP